MLRLCIIVALTALNLADLTAVCESPGPREKGTSAATQQFLPVGRWRIEFANGVIETCEIRQNRSAYVSEPLRSSPGTAWLKDGAVVIFFNDNRAERWTLQDGQLIVEHWCPSKEYPSGTPVVGVAKRAP